MDPDRIQELFAQFRRVEVRRMFGGAGIVAEGLTLGVVFGSVIYLRVDEATIPEFKREGSAPFVYPLAKRANRRPSNNFWKMPERLYDEPEELARWAARSFAIAQRKRAEKPKPGKRKAVEAKASKRPTPARPKAARRKIR